MKVEVEKGKISGLDGFINKILQGDVIKVLRTLPSKSVHCVVTSPRPTGACGITVPLPGSVGIKTAIIR